MIELITVKEYIKRERITDTAVRKRIKSGVLEVVQLDDVTHIVYRNDVVKDMKHKIKLQALQIQRLKESKKYLEAQRVLYERNYLTMKEMLKVGIPLNIEEKWFDGSLMILPKNKEK